MYSLTKNFLYKSNKYNMLKLTLGEVFSINGDDNTRTLNIVFPENTLYSRLKSIPGFTIINPEELIIEESLLLRKEILTIGNDKYYFKNGISRFSQLYNTVLETRIYEQGEMCFVSIKRDNIPSEEEYKELLNKSGIVYCELGPDFYIYNYNDVEVSRSIKEPSRDTKCTDFRYLSISATDTNSSFLRHCKNHYPEFEILTEFSDLSNLKNNINGYLCIKLGLPNWQTGDHTTKLFQEYNPLYPKYGRYMIVATRGFMEYITSDWDKYLEVRYDFLLMRKLFQRNKFIVYPENNEEFNAIVVFDESIDDNVDRSPSERNVESSKLYSLKINFTIYSYIVESYLEYPYITKAIVNTRINNDEIVDQFVITEEGTKLNKPPIETPPYAEYNGKP